MLDQPDQPADNPPPSFIARPLPGPDPGYPRTPGLLNASGYKKHIPPDGPQKHPPHPVVLRSATVDAGPAHGSGHVITPLNHLCSNANGPTGVIAINTTFFPVVTVMSKVRSKYPAAVPTRLYLSGES